MDKEKRVRLEAKGWKFGSVEEFLDMEIKTPIEWSELAEDFLDADGNIFRANQIADALNTATAREARLVERIENLRTVIAEAIRLTHETWTANGLSEVLLADTETALADINPNGDGK